MGSVCFIVDAMVTGEMLPRHLKSIRESGVADHLLPILVTTTQAQERLSAIEQRYHAHSLITPARPLGARLNKAASASQAEWLIIALQKKPLSADLWGALYPQLNTYTLDALIIGFTRPTLSERILRRLLASALILPPYIAVRRAWLERLGGFDPELDDNSAIDDFLQRLHACPTRLKTYSGHLLSQMDEPDDDPMLPNPEAAVTPRP
ncbi:MULTISPECIES: glycosyltransferase family A protein [unclassified Halomonas]|uniref:glycosyltransferase family A protein n=1 Tax=unclassified Halomonas TaxID=2609666 RepID=UPI001CF2A988|nr:MULTISPECIES: glycosyltransferase family A protein [unclassified Halomonas]MCA8865531.1 glycosyltransferase family 2 protein [Halomonas sp. SBBP1]UZH10391.1 glycosyltransferase family 2 protein [Halomonas sp. BDJS001]